MSDFKKDGFLSFENEVMPELMANHTVYALPFSGKFIDIGVPEDFYRAQDVIQEWTTRRKRKAVFMDRDGTINIDTGYVYKKEDLQWVPGVLDFMRAVLSMGYEIVIITNQAGVAKGKYSIEDYRVFQNHLITELAKEKIQILDTYYCPDHPEGKVSPYNRESLFRKPSPAMVLEAADKHFIAISDSYMVGDKETDAVDLPYLRTFLLKGKYPIKDGLSVYSDFQEIMEVIKNV